MDSDFYLERMHTNTIILFYFSPPKLNDLDFKIGMKILKFTLNVF